MDTMMAPHHPATPRQHLRQAIAALALLACLAGSAAASVERAGTTLDLPELTAAIAPTHQVSLRLTLELSGPRAEKLARERLIRLRHALVLQLAGLDAGTLDAIGVEHLLESYRQEANSVLGTRNAVRGVLVQKFVVQGK